MFPIPLTHITFFVSQTFLINLKQSNHLNLSTKINFELAILKILLKSVINSSIERVIAPKWALHLKCIETIKSHSYHVVLYTWNWSLVHLQKCHFLGRDCTVVIRTCRLYFIDFHAVKGYRNKYQFSWQMDITKICNKLPSAMHV